MRADNYVKGMIFNLLSTRSLGVPALQRETWGMNLFWTTVARHTPVGRNLFGVKRVEESSNIKQR